MSKKRLDFEAWFLVFKKEMIAGGYDAALDKEEIKSVYFGTRMSAKESAEDLLEEYRAEDDGFLDGYMD